MSWDGALALQWQKLLYSSFSAQIRQQKHKNLQQGFWTLYMHRMATVTYLKKACCASIGSVANKISLDRWLAQLVHVWFWCTNTLCTQNSQVDRVYQVLGKPDKLDVLWSRNETKSVCCLGQKVSHKRLRTTGHAPQHLGLSTRVIVPTLPLSKQNLKSVAQAYSSVMSCAQMFQPTTVRDKLVDQWDKSVWRWPELAWAHVQTLFAWQCTGEVWMSSLLNKSFQTDNV